MNKLHISKQESLLTLLYTDTPSAAMIRNVLTPELFEGDYADMALAAFAYYDRYRKAPGAHAEELFADRIQSGAMPESKMRRFYEILRMIRTSAPLLNKEFCLTYLSAFTRKQALKKAFIEVGDLLQNEGEDETQMDQAERIMLNAFRTRTLIDTGFRFHDKGALDTLFKEEEELFPTGIEGLDSIGIGPQRKTLMGYIAPKKSGKTWFMIQLAKTALMHNLKVLHVSLEMSERAIAQRYLQSLFALPKRHAEYTRTIIERDQLGTFHNFSTFRVNNKMTLLHPEIEGWVENKLNVFERTLRHLVIKDYPTGALTIAQLNTYLDILEQQERFTPDLLIVDYPRIMLISPKSVREELGQIYIDLRRIATERNIAVAVPAQANREGAAAKRVRSTHVSEDISLTHTADTVITYSQTEPEYEAGLARLFVDDARNEEAKVTLVITQHYPSGQYCLESTRLDNKTGDLLRGFLEDGASTSDEAQTPAHQPTETASILSA